MFKSQILWKKLKRRKVFEEWEKEKIYVREKYREEWERKNLGER